MRVRPMRAWTTRVAGASTADASTADARVRRYEYGRREYGRCEYADASTADAGMDDVSTADASTAGASTADASRMRVGCVRAQETSNPCLAPSRVMSKRVRREHFLRVRREERAGARSSRPPRAARGRARCRCGVGVGAVSVRSRCGVGCVREEASNPSFASSREMPHGIGGRAAIWSGATLGEQHGRKMRESCTAYACARVLGFAFGRVACAYSVRGGRVRKAVRE
jgi:hypothetical protein